MTPTAQDLDAAIPALAAFPRHPLLQEVTPLDAAPRLSQALGISLHIKRDDMMGLGFGGNKVRQLEYYFGEAVAQKADHILITGAVQSNYMRLAAAAAAKLGMKAILQLEHRVPNMPKGYDQSGNVLLFKLLGAELHHYPVGEDEAGADAAVAARAADLAAAGHNPYQIHLAPGHRPLGALGYVRGAAELALQAPHVLHADAALVVASGSGFTHAGILTGLRLVDCPVPVFGMCVRRDATLQQERIANHCRDICHLLGVSNPVRPDDIQIFDQTLAPGYGQLNDAVREAIRLTAQCEGLFLDPVYTGRTMAELIALTRNGELAANRDVVFLHTGGTPALFAYADQLAESD